MIRRIHIRQLRVGEHPLDESEAHHARDVLRLPDGASIELFDDAGQSADGILIHHGAHGATVRVGEISAQSVPHFQLTIASAVPKGERADWMVEKLSELGVVAFIPLATARSVVHPQGQGKRQRWERIATESAKQCRRVGVMRIEPLMNFADVVKATEAGWFLSTGQSKPISQALRDLNPAGSLTLFVGPEGGWTEPEIETFDRRGLTAVALTATILRVETAAIAAAAVVSTGTNEK
ncbi:MAG TPA: RsmE family RNA methyltransferase [Humisphaera sp.]|nr:RsmE family RNA methyltransferase [Humisphaera sp.]